MVPTPQLSAAMPTLKLDSIELYCEHLTTVHSERPAYPLLMISGMASDSASWQPVQQALSAKFELIIPDNRCTGRTRPTPVETNRALMVNDLVALLDKLDIERVNVLGHSMGAMLGWALAAQAPDRVNRLVSASALPWVIPARVALFNSLASLRTQHNEAQWFELLYQFLFSPAFFEHPAAVKQAVDGSINYPHKQSLESFVQQAAALESFLPNIDIAKVDCPVSLLTGANDLLMTPALMTQFCVQHDLTFTIIEHAAHAIHWEQPEAFVEYVISQLAI